MLNETGPSALEALARLSQAEFVSHWRSIIGEPPAIMLESRSEMIQLLIESPPAATSDLNELSVGSPHEHPGED